MLAAESMRRAMVLEPTHTSDTAFDSPMILLQPVIVGHILDDATGGWEKRSAGCILGRPGQGRREHLIVGRPSYLMSCELALLSGRPCDQPGCAVSADP